MKEKNLLTDYLSSIGKKGGKTTKKKYGKDHYRKIARKRWDKLSPSKPLA